MYNVHATTFIISLATLSNVMIIFRKDAGNYTCVASWLTFKSKPAYRSYILEVIERQPWATPPLINKDHPGNHTVKVGTVRVNF